MIAGWPAVFGLLGLIGMVGGHQAFGRECVCERKLKPVCGTDGQTYENMCQFECAKRLHAAISVQYGGSCCAPASLCPAGVYAPICDNFGSMHNNECLFEYNKCLAKKMYGVSLKVGAANKCAEFVPTNDTRLCEFECKDELDLVCDNLGQTHKNQCFFEQVICEQQLKKLPTASLIHKGRCNNGKYPKSSQRASSFGTPIQEFGQSGGAGEGNDAKLFFHQPDDPFINQNPYDLFVPATVETTAESSAASSPQPPMSTTITPWSTSNPAYTNKAPEQPEANPSTPEPFVPQTTGIPSTEFTDGAECSALNCNYKQWAPLCDTRNRTHRNACLFEFRVCKLKKMGATRNIPEIAYHGACSFGVMSQPSPNATQHSDVPPTSPLAREGFCRVCEEADGEVPIPVCDNANETHISACRLAQRNCEHRANGVEERVLVHVGICRNNSLVFTMENEVCPSTCSKNYKPVCASDGITHPNLCTFQMINCRQRKMKKPDPAWLVYLHECRQPERESEETIGNENDDVENTQEVDVTSTTPFAPPETTTTANQSQLENFECPVPDCSADEQPTVCDNEGTIHKSECMFTWARCVAARAGRTLHLVSDDECPANKCRLLESKVCTNEYNPICGSDFRVHPNDCFFEKARCADSELEVLFKGECQLCLKQPCPIPDPANEPDSLFFCDQNGETKSRCEFEMIRCIYEIRFGYNITPAYEGKCCPSLDSCPLSSDPICDSRGRLHRNRCHFDVANCRSLKIERTAPAQVAPTANCSIMNLQHGIRSVNSATIPAAPASFCNRTLSSCSEIYAPVCGSNGRTYPNECHFFVRTCNQTAPVEIMHKGMCCTSESCPATFAPVCDQLGNSHLNLCEFGKRRCLHERMAGVNLTIASFGSCPDDPCISACPQVYSPVCGMNGITYVNQCELKNVNCLRSRVSASPIDVDYMDECCAKEQCDPSSETVCDAENRSHANLCDFNFESCTRQRRSNSTLQLAYSGACCRLPEGECAQSGPVCDSTGATHKNRCEFELRRCMDEKIEPKRMATIVHSGTCCEMEDCVGIEEPVCDTRGTTHSTPCDFRNAQCIHEMMNPNVTLAVDYNGRCCADNCGNEGVPTCDQNGLVYQNKCRFELRQCQSMRRGGIKLVETSCPPARLESTSSSLPPAQG